MKVQPAQKAVQHLQTDLLCNYQKGEFALNKDEKRLLFWLQATGVSPSATCGSLYRLVVFSIVFSFWLMFTPALADARVDYFINGSILSLWGGLCAVTFCIFLRKSFRISLLEISLRKLFLQPGWLKHDVFHTKAISLAHRQTTARFIRNATRLIIAIAISNVVTVLCLLVDVFNKPYISALFTKVSLPYVLLGELSPFFQGIGMIFSTALWLFPLLIYIVPSFVLYLRFNHLVQECHSLLRQDRVNFYVNKESESHTLPIGDTSKMYPVSFVESFQGTTSATSSNGNVQSERKVINTADGNDSSKLENQDDGRFKSDENKDEGFLKVCHDTKSILFELNTALDSIDDLIVFINGQLGVYVFVVVMLNLYLCLFLVYQILFSDAILIVKLVSGMWFVFNIGHGLSLLVPCATVHSKKDALSQVLSKLAVYRVRGTECGTRFLLLQHRVEVMKTLQVGSLEISWKIIGRLVSIFSSAFFIMYNVTNANSSSTAI